MRKCILAWPLPIILCCGLVAQDGTAPVRELLTLGAAEETESYAVYRAVLKNKEPRVTDWIIVRETWPFKLCSGPTVEQASIYQSMVDDYVVKAKRKVILERKFDLPEYTLAGPEEWKNMTDHKVVAVFSAIGFNPARTRAIVCYWANSGGTCSVLVKKTDMWEIDLQWQGDGCGWAA